MDAAGRAAARDSGRHDERATVGGANRPGDQAAAGEPVEDAGEGRALVREAGVQLAYAGRTGCGEVREDVGLALGEPVLTQVREVEADAVRRPMNRWNQV